MIKIAVDAFGGDNSPDAIAQGVKLALDEYKDIYIILCGDKTKLEGLESLSSCDRSRFEIVHAPEIILPNEHPVNAVRQKKQSSLVSAIEQVANKSAGAVVSAGSTGALLAGATFIIKRINGVKRPALAPLVPTVGTSPVMLLDSGANADCKAEYLLQFAIMGYSYMNKVAGVNNPKVGLLNIGQEEEKGDELRKQAYALLKNTAGINFIGNIEARDLLSGNCDVVVADGFSGNIALKLIEGVASSLFAMIKQELYASTRTKIGAALAKPAFKNVKGKLDYSEHGGAMLLGINGGVIKAHGSSDARAFFNAIRQARAFVQGDVANVTRQAIEAQMAAK